MRFTQLAQVIPTTGTLSSAGAREVVGVLIGPDRILQGSIRIGAGEVKRATACSPDDPPLP
jgi:hypothetical protein